MHFTWIDGDYSAPARRQRLDSSVAGQCRPTQPGISGWGIARKCDILCAQPDALEIIACAN